MNRTTIDGFIRRKPVRTVAVRPRPAHRHAAFASQAAPSAVPRSIISATVPSATRAPQPRSYANAPPAKRRRSIPTIVQLPLVVMGAVAAGILAQSEAIGQIFVVLYGIAALIWKIPSRTTFSIALLSMIATTLLLVVRGNVPLAQSFATYTFLLLVAGVITLSRELKKEGGRLYSSRKIIP